MSFMERARDDYYEQRSSSNATESRLAETPDEQVDPLLRQVKGQVMDLNGKVGVARLLPDKMQASV